MTQDTANPARITLTAAQALADLEERLGEPAPHLRLLADLAPTSLHGYHRLFQALLRDPEEGGSLPRRYKALLLIAIATAKGKREAAVLWSRVAVRWGLRIEELLEAVGFFITGQGMSTFQEISQHCLRAGLAVAATTTPAEPLLPFVAPADWASRALPQGDLPLAEQPAIVAPGDASQAAIHAYFERSFNAPMPEFWARLGRETPEILEGYYLLRRETMKRPEEGGFTPKKVKELIAVAIDTVLANPWGGEAHLRSAMLNGATLDDVREVEGLVIMEVGMVAYKMMGFHFLVKAEEIARALAD